MVDFPVQLSPNIAITIENPFFLSELVGSRSVRNPVGLPFFHGRQSLPCLCMPFRGLFDLDAAKQAQPADDERSLCFRRSGCTTAVADAAENAGRFVSDDYILRNE